MANSFTETTTQGWFSRIKQSFKGIVGGFLAIMIGMGLLWYNEGRAIKTAKGLEEGAELVLSISKDSVLSRNNGKLVHLTGDVTSTDSLSDPIFPFNRKALKLRRNVEMYQWIEEVTEETKKKVGGSEETVTTYNYAKGWSNRLHASDQFKQPKGHENPKAIPYSEFNLGVEQAKIGQFSLSKTLFNQLYDYSDIVLKEANYVLRENQSIDSDGKFIYEGRGEMAAPEIGDVRISFQQIDHGVYSIIAQQLDSTFVPFNTQTGTTINMIVNGEQTAAAMFQQAEQDNRNLTWILRFLGLVLIIVGFKLILEPLRVLADVIPFVGKLVGAGTFLIALVLGLSIGFVVIALAWLAYRPMIGIPLLVLAILGFYYLMRKRKDTQLAS